MVLLAANAVRVAHFEVPVRTPDESTYLFYARSLYERGPSALPEIVREYRSRPELRDYPSPTRVGHVALQWAAMLVTSNASVGAATAVSFAASIGLLLIVWRLGTFFGPWVAPIAMGFLAFSPMDLAMYRRLWGDEPFAFAVTALLWCFLEFARSGRVGWIVAFAVALAGALLIKETALFFFGFALWAAWWEGDRRRAVTAGIAALSAVAVALVIQTLACGGWEPVREALAGAAGAGDPNEYMRKYQTGGLEYYAVGLGLLQPVPIALGLLASVGVAVAALVARFRRGPAPRLAPAWPPATWILGSCIALFMIVALVYPQKNMRFLSPIYPALFVMAGAAVVAGVGWLMGRVAVAARPALIGGAILALVALAYTDHARFVHYFIERGIPDLATPWFTGP